MSFSNNLPWEYLPTTKLKIDYDIPLGSPKLVINTNTNNNYQQPYKSSSSSSSSSFNVIKTELSETDGKAILDFIYEKGDSLLSKGVNSSSSSLYQQQNKKHKDTFYIPSSNKKIDSDKLGLIDKFFDSCSIPSSINIKHINRNLLESKGVRIFDLIKKCKVSITDLKAAGIINNLDDLVALKLHIRDLTIDRDYFNVDKLVTIFNIYYKDLEKFPIGLTPNNIVKCDFYPNELETLKFNMDQLKKHGIRKNEMIQMKFNLTDWIKLGFNSSFAIDFKIDINSAKNEFHWDINEFMELMND